MKFLHTSDWHLGASDGDFSLYEDQKHFIDQICEAIEKESIDAVLIAGDVYDRSVASGEAIRLYDYAMTRICGDLNKDVITIAGNHDSADRLASCNSLLKKAGLHILGILTREPVIVSYPDSDVYLLPWITAERVKSVYPEERENIQTLTDAYRVACDYMRATFVPNKKHIILSHAFITNAETSTSDRAAEIGFATQVAASVFDGFDYVALGHIHKPQDVNEKVRYCGTPMAYSFGKEEKQVKSVTVLDTDTMERCLVPLKPLHARTTVKGTLDELLHNSMEKDVLEGFVRAEVTDSYVGLEAISRLKERFTNLFEVIGKSYDDSEATIRMTMDEFREMETDPKKIFEHFCRETLGMETVDDHTMKLFEDAVKACSQEEE